MNASITGCYEQPRNHIWRTFRGASAGKKKDIKKGRSLLRRDTDPREPQA